MNENDDTAKRVEDALLGRSFLDDFITIGDAHYRYDQIVAWIVNASTPNFIDVRFSWRPETATIRITEAQFTAFLRKFPRLR